MKSALIKKFSRKKQIHSPIAALPIIAEENVSLHSWKQKAAKLHFLDQELDLLNQKIGILQNAPPPEYVPGKKTPESEKSVAEKLSEKKAPLIIKVSTEYAAISPRVNAITDLLERLEQTELETGKMIRVSPVLGTIEENTEIDLHYHSNNTLLLRLQSAILELQQKWNDTQQRLQTIKSAPPEVKENLSRIDKELSQMRTFARAKGKVISTTHPLEHELAPSWERIKQTQNIEKIAQQKMQKVLAEISSQPKPYQEKLSAISDQLSNLKRSQLQKVQRVTTAPETGHYSLSPKIQKKARQEVQKIVNSIDQENKKKELSAIDKELSKLQETQTEDVKIVTAVPIAVHQFSPSTKIQKKARKEVQRIIKNINQQKRTEELSAINTELSQLDKSQPQKVKIITTAALAGHHTISPEIKKKAKKEMKQILTTINSQKKTDQSLSEIDAELASIEDIPTASGKIILSIPSAKEKKTGGQKLKEAVFALFKHHNTKKSSPFSSQKTKNTHHRHKTKSRNEELTNIDKMLQKITQDLAEEKNG
ncbi:MAG: hypothetical protein Q8R37_01910 [Nanoarchaeota archaeon]|nr:hypothetical protein [Nanoarchaeota archaeon]